MDTIAAVSLAANPLLIGVLAYMLRRWIERLERIVEAFGKSQQECQISLAKVYRTKVDAEDDSRRQWTKIDNHGERIAVLEALCIGDGK